MIIRNINHDCSYHTEKIAVMFFPLEKLKTDGDDNVVIETQKENNTLSVRVRAFSRFEEQSRTITSDTDVAHEMSILLYDTLSKLTGYTMPWGILYGVRPARLMHATVESVGREGAVKKFLSDKVQQKKIDLALSVMERENRIIELSSENSFSLYVSIPFCPSRCSYCSFVSHSIANAQELIEPYVELLCRELEYTGSVAKELGLRLESVYFGGGTPTTLSPSQLDSLLRTIERSFDLSTVREYTVEAGRPDTVTREKLDTLLSHNVSRISINPQTFNDDVLKSIGRKHTAKQTLDAYNLARQMGFGNINMDFIAGLNSDTLDSFKQSIDTAINLSPESITVHNLALKSGAYLCTENELFDLTKRSLATQMIDYSYNSLTENAYNPYYMYRQSKSLGNLENVGYAREGYDCLYNIFMMDETHTVLAAGAGAVIKLKNPKTAHIERIYNYKYPYEYINNFEQIISRKKGIFDFYSE
ncbi:coproporphyrinogen dehydrogenase HemZ [Eubacterium sp.]|uniref:coproporphyrinogen dehydrogenase HemZ n=1 Tax=Eubacterium sp. TaxID=142586 RepID=UPI003F0C365F